MASLMVGIGNGTTSTPMLCFNYCCGKERECHDGAEHIPDWPYGEQMDRWGPKPARLLWVPSSQSNVGLLRGLQYRDRCACSRGIQTASGLRNGVHVALMAAREDTLELLFASSPPSVTAAVMKECVLDEYSTKHRISINRFLQLKIFVKVHDR
uniref:Uncharacterized protein n=1 Tax=Oryza nivara TaxID=4536 RepID=A0A0E0IQ70_ORYNI